MNANLFNKKLLKVVLIIGCSLLFFSIAIYLVAVNYERSLIKDLNNEWLSKTTLVDSCDVPHIEWIEDAKTSHGFDSFVYLDEKCDDIKYLVFTRWPIPLSSYYWWKSRMGGEYFYTNTQKKDPEYLVERNDSILHIMTSSRPDSWVYLSAVDKQSDCYALDFDYLPKGEQYETLQIDVRLKSLANRLKFVIRNNRDVKFDMYMQSNPLAVSNDERWRKFITPVSLSKEDYSHIRLEVIHDYYSLIVNEKRIISIKVDGSSTVGDYWCLMSWNSYDEIPCEFFVKNFKILRQK